MKARLCVLLLVLIGISTAAAQAAAAPPANGHALVKGDARARRSSSPNLIYHGGPVMTARRQLLSRDEHRVHGFAVIDNSPAISHAPQTKTSRPRSQS